MLNSWFVTKDVPPGSQRSGSGVLTEFVQRLGYKRNPEPQEARAWDQVTGLERHRKWTG
jgi:hypothetical protein